MFRPSVSLDRATCHGLLATQTLGRLVFTRHALPDVLPARYHLDGEGLMIRLARGSAAAVASRSAVIAFEVDHLDPQSGAGWSVTVVGQAAEVTADDPARPEAGDAGVICLRVSTHRMTGHRLRVEPTPLPPRP